MAAPTFTLINSQPLTSADSNTGWNDLTTADPDIKVEGTNAMSGILRADGEQGYYDAGSAPVSAAGKTVRGWIFTNNIAYMGTEASDGYKLLAYDGSTTELKTIFGSDTYPGGWFNYVWDMDAFTTLTLANVRRWGVEAGHAVSAKNVVNTWMDVIRYLDGYSMTGGTSGDKVRLADIATLDKVSAYAVVSVSPNAANVFFATGTVQFGTGATAHYFEIDGDVLTFKDLPIAAGLYSLSGVGSGTDVLIKNALIQAAGTTAATRFIFDMSDTNLASFEMTATTIRRASDVDFKSGQSVLGNVFDNCGQITPSGADMTGCVVRGYEGTADTAALVWNSASDPTGLLDDMSFVKGTASTHAISFADTIPSSITLNNIDFSGYNASNAQTDSTLYFADTGGTITVNLVGCTGNVSYKSAGATITLVIDPVTTLITVKNAATGAIVVGSRVYLTAAAGGPLSEGTVIINALTNGSGQVSDTRSWSSDQPAVGWARKGTSSTYFAQAPISLTIDSLSGITATVQAVPDE